MAWVRKGKFVIVCALINTFSVLLVVTIGSEIAEDIISFSLVDFEDRTEPNEGQKSDNQLKDYNLNYLKSINSATLFVGNCSKFGQFDIKHSLEVFLEVVTPPPEA